MFHISLKFEALTNRDVSHFLALNLCMQVERERVKKVNVQLNEMDGAGGGIRF